MAHLSNQSDAQAGGKQVISAVPRAYHYITVHEIDYGNKSDSSFEIIHPVSCPEEIIEHMAGYYAGYICPEGAYIDGWGVDDLLHEIDEPGTYTFEYWSERTYNYVIGEDFDDGLRLVQVITAAKNSPDDTTGAVQNATDTKEGE